MKPTISHPDLVAVLQKPGAAIINQLTPARICALHMAVGICGEAGELIDAVKKNTIYNKPLDRKNVIEELGDLEFYLEGIRQVYGITRQETLDANVIKLSVRYEGLQYSDTAAHAREDKQ